MQLDNMKIANTISPTPTGKFENSNFVEQINKITIGRKKQRTLM